MIKWVKNSELNEPRFWKMDLIFRMHLENSSVKKLAINFLSKTPIKIY